MSTPVMADVSQPIANVQLVQERLLEQWIGMEEHAVRLSGFDIRLYGKLRVLEVSASRP
jgi:hypothetical protein